MDSDTDKTAVWKLFFVAGGFVSLFIWNSLLNLVDYFEKALEPNSFSLVAFTFCFGQVASILTASVVFQGYKIRYGLNLSLGSVLFAFFCMIYFVEFTLNTETNKICVLLAALLIGYVSAYFQSKTFALAAQCSVEEMLYVSFGTGLAGVLTNLFSFFVSLMYPTRDDTEVLSVLRRQVLLYLLMTVVAFIAYLVIQHEFQVHYKSVLDKLESGEREIEHAFSDVISYTTTKAEEEWRIIRTGGDLMANTTLLYVVTIVFVVYLNVKCYFAFDDNRNAFNVAYYMFFFNIFDSVGKLLPEKLTLKNERWLWVFNGLRLLVVVHVFLVLVATLDGDWADPWLRMVWNSVLGLTNGLMTNSVYDQINRKFKSRYEKSKAEYMVVLCLVTGVGVGALAGVVLNDLHLG